MRIGLALSGGGVRGLAHVGVINALRENDIAISDFSGVSAGALVGVMAAAECSVEDMLDFWTETNPLSVWNLALGGPAIFNTLNYVEPLKRFVKAENFEELPHGLTVCASEMLSGRLDYFDSGPLWPIVLASATFPIVFSPVEIGDKIYMDGGIIDNFPVEPLAQKCDVVIGINVDPPRSIAKEDFRSMQDVIERVMDMRYHMDGDKKASLCDVVIRPARMDLFSSFQTSAMLDIFQLGYEAGIQAIPRIREKIEASLDTSP